MIVQPPAGPASQYVLRGSSRKAGLAHPERDAEMTNCGLRQGWLSADDGPCPDADTQRGDLK